MQFMATSLQKAGALEADNLDEILESVVCNVKYKNCMYGDCSGCSETKVDFRTENDQDLNTWDEWKTKKEKRMIKQKRENT